MEETISKLKYELATLKNYSHYMENVQKMYSKKYETLGSIMADYLESMMYGRGGEAAEAGEVGLNLEELRGKDTKEWVFEEMEAVVHLLLAQIKPFMSVESSPCRNKA